MAHKRVFLDANVLLTILLDRDGAVAAREFLAKTDGEFCISALTGHLVMHFGSQFIKTNTLKAFLSDYTMLPLGASEFIWAYESAQGKDFEDALQIATAIRAQCALFCTFDKKLRKFYASQDASLEVVLL